MARMNKNEYPTIHADNLSKPILFVVDMVNGFVKEGALADPEIDKIASNIENLILTLSVPTVFIADWHEKDAKEFESYPVHCLADSEESRICDTLLPYAKNVLHKNSTNTFMAGEFLVNLEQFTNYDTFVITGCCTDLCIMQFALSLNSWLNENNCHHKKIVIPVDCVDTYDIPGVHDAIFWNETALENMKTNGIEVVKQIEK